jgi:ribulose-phosphate 3-epimerase
MEKIINSLDQSEAEYIHFDVMDGDFVPNLTFGPQFISNLRNQTKKVFDVHLMINRVGKFLDDYVKAGSDIITFHIEIEENLSELISKIKDKNIKAGIAIKPRTPWEEIKVFFIQ